MNKSIQSLCCGAEFSVCFEREWAIKGRHVIELNYKYRRERYWESRTLTSTQCGRDSHLLTKCLTNRFIYPSNEWQITRQSLMIELENKMHAHCSVRSRCCVLIRDLFIYFLNIYSLCMFSEYYWVVRGTIQDESRLHQN